jgi:DNA-binding CsgD family transcriptional regulator
MHHLIDFLAFGDALGRTRSIQDSMALFLAAIQTLGYSTYDYAFGTAKVPNPKSALDLDFQFMDANTDWEHRYLTCGYLAVDRMTPVSLATVTPHLYGDTLWTPATGGALQVQMEDDLHQKGIFSGLSIPMHMAGNRFGIMNLGSSLPVEEFARLDAQTRPVVTLIAHILHDHVVRNFWPQTRTELTVRERECLQWAAQGKTAWETGEILGIAERTVKKHIGSAMVKLSATTRTQAVAKAAARGLIVP